MDKDYILVMNREFSRGWAGLLEAQEVDGSVIETVGSLLEGEGVSGPGLLARVGGVASGKVSCGLSGSIINTYPFGTPTDKVYDVFLGICIKPATRLHTLFERALAYCRDFERTRGGKSAYETGTWPSVILLTNTWDPVTFAKFESRLLYHAIRYGFCFTILLCTDYGFTLVPFLPQGDAGRRALENLHDQLMRDGGKLDGLSPADSEEEAPKGWGPEPPVMPHPVRRQEEHSSLPDMYPGAVADAGRGTDLERWLKVHPVITYVSNIGTYASEEWEFDLIAGEWSMRSAVSVREGTIPAKQMNRLLEVLTSRDLHPGMNLTAPGCTLDSAAYQLFFADTRFAWSDQSKAPRTGDGFFTALQKSIDQLTKGCLRPQYLVRTVNFPIS